MHDDSPHISQSLPRENIHISEYLATKLGTSARYFMEAQSLEQIHEGVHFARTKRIPFLILGSGYSVVMPPRMYPGLVIKNNCHKFDIVGRRGKYVGGQLHIEKALISLESGAILNQVVRFVISEGYGGLEELLGLPGTVGGAILDGAIPDQIFKKLFVSAQIIDRDNIIKEVTGRDFLSQINSSEDNILLSLVLSLLPQDKDALWNVGTEAMSERELRYPKNTLLCRVFSPVTMSDAFRSPTPSNTQNVHVLIDKAGLLGYKAGGVQVSETDGNTLLNLGNATSEDVFMLITLMQRRVFAKFGILLALRLKQFTV